MKKVYAIILSGAAILAVVACNKEVQVEDNSQNNEPVYETLSVKVGAETKVTLETNAAKSAFEKGDKIAVWTDAGEFQECAVNGEGKITVDVSQPRSNYAVYYNGTTLPSYSAETLSIALPSSYAYADVADDKNPVPMVAKNVSGESGDMTFYAVGTLFRVTVKAIPSGATGLVFQFPGNKVNGTFTVTNPGTSTPSVATTAPGSGEDKVTVTFEAGTATEMTLNIPLPTGAYDDVYITPVGGETKVASARHIKAGGYTAARANGRTLTATLVSFSVSSEKKVIFAPANLLYVGSASTNKWRFASTQYYYKGSGGDHPQNDDSETATRDLFGWGTSGWGTSGDATWTNYYPWSTANTATTGIGNNYGYGPKYISEGDSNNLTGVYAGGDWGIFNQIDSFEAGFWRTPTGGEGGEWEWLIGPGTRKHADESMPAPNPGVNCRVSSTVGGVPNARFVRVQVNATNGLIIFPDSYVLPAGLTLNKINNLTSSFNDNVIDLADWSKMEDAGAVLLIAAGIRELYSVNSLTQGYYWSSSARNAKNGFAFAFGTTSGYETDSINRDQRNRGMTVRLVRDLN